MPGGVHTQESWGFVFMALSWSLVEVFRYSYYAVDLVGPVPYPLLWIRYSLFFVLYPTGITGELWTIFNSLAVYKASFVWYVMVALPPLYIPGSPVM